MVETQGSQGLKSTESVFGRCGHSVSTKMKFLEGVESIEPASNKIITKLIEVKVKTDQRIHGRPGLTTPDLSKIMDDIDVMFTCIIKINLHQLESNHQEKPEKILTKVLSKNIRMTTIKIIKFIETLCGSALK